MKNILLFGSKSLSRQSLLNDMNINFLLVSQDATEVVEERGLSFSDHIKKIALQKMDHIIMPPSLKTQEAFVLTADTMGQDARGNIYGKPKNKRDAIEQIKNLRGNGLVGTAFCLDKKKFDGSSWVVEERVLGYAETAYELDMPDGWIERYLDHTPHYLQISGSITVEGYGAQFLKSITGSYTTVLGLPLFQLREGLEQLNFFN
jgi:septum formation protein